MSDYNNGEWHSWNGGDCPVHPKSAVDAVWHDPRRNTAGVAIERQAHEDEGPRLAWSHVVKFRVVKEYTAPRECWTFGSQHFKTEGEAEAFKATMIADRPDLGFETTEIIHMREVSK